MKRIELSKRQETILDIVRQHGPITGTDIAGQLGLSRAALRPDLAILTMSGMLGARPRVGYYCTGKEPTDFIATLLANIRVSEAHSQPVVIKENASVYDAIVTMFIEDVGSLIVVSEGGFLEGIISRKDLLKAAMGGQDLNKLPSNVVMTRMPNVIVSYPEESAVRAAEKLITQQVDTLPVVVAKKIDQEEKLQVIGRFTKTNIARLFVQLAGK
ncbi:MAG: helix-turn-helix transcriptional regulator [Sporomusaceae bacterium]|nr:helix-turn-helix transcriptional regulator [Sporomusaceae bacterium]